VEGYCGTFEVGFRTANQSALADKRSTAAEEVDARWACESVQRLTDWWTAVSTCTYRLDLQSVQ